jgi:hypothetical protein
MIYLPAARPSVTTHRRLTAEALAHERQMLEIYPMTKIELLGFLGQLQIKYPQLPGTEI